VKRGPTGVIVNTMNDAFATAQFILNDFNDGIGNVRLVNTFIPPGLGKLPVAEYSGEAIKKLLPSIKGDFILIYIPQMFAILQA